MTRKQLKKEMQKLIYDLRQTNFKLEGVLSQARMLSKKESEITTQLDSICNELGKTWSDLCPAFKQLDQETSCLIDGWTDSQKTAKFCINCQIPADQISIRCLMKKLEGN